MIEAIVVGVVLVAFVYYIMKKDGKSGTKPQRPPEQNEEVL